MPRKKPASVVVIGILQIVFGSLALTCALPGLANGQLTGGFNMGAMQNPGAANFDAQKMQAEMNRRMPWLQPFSIGTTVAYLVLCVLMIVGGIGLLNMQSWARALTIAYACLCILYIIVYSVGMFAVLPAMTDAMRQAFAQMKPPGGGGGPPPPDAATMASFVQIVMVVVIILMDLWVIYPIIVLSLMLRPSVAAAFRGGALPEEQEDYDDRYREEDERRPDDRYPPDEPLEPDERFRPGR